MGFGERFWRETIKKGGGSGGKCLQSLEVNNSWKKLLANSNLLNFRRKCLFEFDHFK